MMMVSLVLALSLVWVQKPPEIPYKEQALKVHAVLKEYFETMDELPGSIMDLYREGFADDPLLFFREFSPASRLAKKFPDLADPFFRLVGKEWQGDVIAYGPTTYHHEVYYLSAEGTFRREPLDSGKHFGSLPKSRFGTFLEHGLEQPTAELGFTLTELKTDRGDPAVVVYAIIPGYKTGFDELAFGNKYPLPGDRIVSVGGYRVKSLEALFKTYPRLAAVNLRTFHFLRDGKIHEGNILYPVSFPGLNAYGKMAQPKLVHGLAKAFLSKEGPGYAGVTTKVHKDGEVLTKIDAGSGAEKAGLRAGDVVTHVEGNPITQDSPLTQVLKVYTAGTTVRLKILRKGRDQEVSITLGKMKGEEIGRMRFQIHEGLMQIDKAMQYADTYVTPNQVIQLLKKGRSPEAALEWVNGVIRKPRSSMQKLLLWQAYGGRAGLLDGMGRWKEAFADLERAEKAHGKMFFHHAKGKLLWDNKQYDEALRWFRKDIETAKWGKPGKIYDLGDKLMKIERFEEARAEFRKLLEDKNYADLAKGRLEDIQGK